MLNFSFVAPSSEELWLRKENAFLRIVHGFRVESVTLAKKAKAYPKRSRMVQIPVILSCDDVMMM